MTLLVLGAALFLGLHSVRIWGDGLRNQLMDRMGEGPWKGLYSLISLVSLVLIVLGYAEARATPRILWQLGVGARHGGSTLVLVGFVLLVVAYLPAGFIKVTVRHPMVLGTALWAAGHLLANGTAADLVLFGGFLAWSATLYPVARGRGPITATPSFQWDVVGVVVGGALWAAMAFAVHAWLFGVAPFG